ncbi:hypothetical protein HanHA300_Chr08g0298451 [Helianthus annuus]|nr:hypothetical protein HanHA300_Chr08g0298451 [Helianthus annuus]KAJ0549006.1 hypothetical protein HanIR_Chr08g0390191 [Helianthus annuus]KAJ0555216.1 hypothetical protein HanHA89_Chr08g0317071 [Helianthus annuus]
MGIRVLRGVHFREVLAYLLPLCNEDTGPVTPALIFRGVTHMNFELEQIRDFLENKVINL